MPPAGVQLDSYRLAGQRDLDVSCLVGSQERLVQGVADVGLVEQVETAAHREIRRGTDTHVQTALGAGGGHPPPPRGQQPVTDFVQLILIEGER